MHTTDQFPRYESARILQLSTFLGRPDRVPPLIVLGACAIIGATYSVWVDHLHLRPDLGYINAIAGAFVGLAIGAIVCRDWLGIVGGLMAGVCGLLIGSLLGMAIQSNPLGSIPGAFIGTVLGSSLGFFFALSADLKRHDAASAGPSRVDPTRTGASDAGP
jgi:hypothetical protein